MSKIKELSSRKNTAEVQLFIEVLEEEIERQKNLGMSANHEHDWLMAKGAKRCLEDIIHRINKDDSVIGNAIEKSSVYYKVDKDDPFGVRPRDKNNNFI